MIQTIPNDVIIVVITYLQIVKLRRPKWLMNTGRQLSYGMRARELGDFKRADHF